MSMTFPIPATISGTLRKQNILLLLRLGLDTAVWDNVKATSLAGTENLSKITGTSVVYMYQRKSIHAMVLVLYATMYQ